MKKTIRTYINTLLLFLIPFVVISLILAILSYFMQTNSFVVNMIIQVISYLLLIVSALYFTSQISEKRLSHCLCFTLIYFLISLLIHLGNIHYLHLFMKSLLFIFIGIFKEIRTRKIA
ncbi:DUF3792 family protein [Candidatus Stoquefichus sp. SB1]|jgi:putative membrane protein (TIGR04086 family)|uniref:DUF3792 family protein n=1 Tax=Candidatus Stoquefichus sp. SB1 TaxID=1658109 RepID=UPI00067F1E22|nr:DUF3792 family protein [Candidatus Stoquefichus sp. SB1]